MSNFLEYRPHLDYKRRLKAILRNYQGEQVPEEMKHEGDADLIPAIGSEERASDRLGSFVDVPNTENTSNVRNGYVPSQVIKETVDLTPTDTLIAFMETKGKIATLVDKIAENLRQDVTSRPSIDEYIKAREQNNVDVIYTFEDYHTENLEGSTAAEVLPILFQLQDELDVLADFLGKTFYPDELQQDLIYLTDQLDRLRTNEERQIQQLIEEDVQIRLDEDRLKEQNHLLDFLYKRAAGVGDFADELDEMLFESPATVYQGSGMGIAQLAASNSALHREFVKQNERRFDREAKNALDAAQRMSRLANPSYKKRLLEETARLQKDKLESRDALSALYLANPLSESDPLNIYILNLLEDIQALKDECDGLVEDLYRINDMEELQNVDYLESLGGKKDCRSLHIILTGVDGLAEKDKKVHEEIDKLFETL